MTIARKIGPYVALATFVAAGACITVVPPPASTVATATPPSAAPTDTASAIPSATDTASSTASAIPTASASATAPPAPTATAPYQPPERPKGKPGRAKRAVSHGRPKSFKQGGKVAQQDAIYWVWYEGGSWHVRVTMQNIEHRFQGVVVSEDGTISVVQPTRPELKDRLKVDNATIGFDFTTKIDEDGFDFNATDDKCVNFYLLVDGQERADRINLGATGLHPPTYNFQLCK